MNSLLDNDASVRERREIASRVVFKPREKSVTARVSIDGQEFDNISFFQVTLNFSINFQTKMFRSSPLKTDFYQSQSSLIPKIILHFKQILYFSTCYSKFQVFTSTRSFIHLIFSFLQCSAEETFLHSNSSNKKLNLEGKEK